MKKFLQVLLFSGIIIQVSIEGAEQPKKYQTSPQRSPGRGSLGIDRDSTMVLMNSVMSWVWSKIKSWTIDRFRKEIPKATTVAELDEIQRGLAENQELSESERIAAERLLDEQRARIVEAAAAGNVDEQSGMLSVIQSMRNPLMEDTSTGEGDIRQGEWEQAYLKGLEKLRFEDEIEEGQLHAEIEGLYDLVEAAMEAGIFLENQNKSLKKENDALREALEAQKRYGQLLLDDAVQKSNSSQLIIESLEREINFLKEKYGIQEGSWKDINKRVGQANSI